MIDFSSAFIDAISSETVKLCELYALTLITGDVLYFTSHNRNVTWNGNTYVTFPLKRTFIDRKLNLEPDSVAVTVANATDDLFGVVIENRLEGAMLTITLIDRTLAYAIDNQFIELDNGLVDIEFDRGILILNCSSLLESLDVQIPRHIYEEGCNSTVGDAECGITYSDYKRASTATSDGGDTFTVIDSARGLAYKVAFDAGDEALPIELGDTVTGQTAGGTGLIVAISYTDETTGFIWYTDLVGTQFIDDEELQNPGADSVVCNGAPASDISFYTQGEIEITSGTNNGYRRMIISHTGNTIRVMPAFPSEVESGDTYNISPGCDETIGACTQRFDNGDNHSGFRFIRRIEETIM